MTPDREALRRYAWLSIAAAITTILLKGGAYVLTGSIALLSDAVESLVNLVTAIAALLALTVAARPPDEEHAYGHGKAEYFASGFEGALILVAAVGIAFAAGQRLLSPEPIVDIGLGLGISIAATAINFGVARVLLRAGRLYESITLEADAHHLMTDVWTTAGVVVGLTLAATTGALWLDPLVALLVALHVLRAGVKLMRRSALGLLDTALPEQDRQAIVEILERRCCEGVQYHALRTRQAGAWRFVSLHVLVPGDWTVQRGHELLEEIEEEIRDRFPAVTVFTHLEPVEDPTSFEDTLLERQRRSRELPPPPPT